MGSSAVCQKMQQYMDMFKAQLRWQHKVMTMHSTLFISKLAVCVVFVMHQVLFFYMMK